ncbi:MAG: ankyrin repeat domain-containing protein [Rhizomicrobium sp.]|nr:ankyrin repeat domain-containing protein [Rhizomicrobium sp.]
MNLRKIVCSAVLALAGVLVVAPHFVSANAETKPPLYDPVQTRDLPEVQKALQNGADVNATYKAETMLNRAIREKNNTIIKLLLAAPGIDVNQRGTYSDDFGSWTRTPLILAAKMGNAEIVSLLLKMGAVVNAKDATDRVPEARGETALLRAAEGDHAEAIRVLVTEAKGLDINAKTKDGESALWIVSQAEDLATVKLLREHGAVANVFNNTGQSVLYTTVLHKQQEVLNYLVAQGVDINHVDNGGLTPLIEGVLSLKGDKGKNAFAFLKQLVSFKPKLDLQQAAAGGNGGFAALHMAAKFGQTEAVALLLDHGATLELKDLALGATALHYATYANHSDTVKLLVKRKANLEPVDKMGATPLLAAAQLSLPEMVQLLADAGAVLDVKSKANALVTPLVSAAANPDPFKARDSLAILNSLLAKKADIDFKSSNGTTALMAASRQSDTSQGYTRASLLISKGAKLDLTNDKGETALMLAAGAGNDRLVKLLMDKGANAAAKNGAGETVTNYAKRGGSRSSVGLLESAGVQAATPSASPSGLTPALFGTWTGSQTGLPYAVFTLTLNKAGSYSFTSKFTAAALKTYPKGINPVLAAHQGTYSLNGETLVLYPSSAAPTSMQWVLEKGVLILDGKTRMKKGK